MKIRVNGEEKEFTGKRLSYKRAVELAGKNPKILYTVTYFARKGNWSLSGCLIPSGKSVAIREGMHVDVCYTGNA